MNERPKSVPGAGMSASDAMSQSAAQSQLDLVRQSIDQFNQQIQLADEMIAGLALVRDALDQCRNLPVTPVVVTGEVGRVLGTLLSELLPVVRDGAEGLTVLVTNWGRRLQVDKQVIAANRDYNANLLRMAETGLVVPGRHGR